MSLLDHLRNDEPSIDFRPIWKRSLPLAGALSVVALLILLVFGVKPSIDFEGGGIFEVPVEDSVTVADARDAIGIAEARVQTVTDVDGQRFIRVQTGSDALDSADQIMDDLAALAGVELDEVSQNTVGPTWGEEISGRAIRALVLFFVLVALYLTFTLEWAMAIGALAAVVHDLLLTAGIYAIFRFEVSPATVIALLTIMGYSLYDTVVVYDKIKDHGTDFRGDYRTMVNAAMNEVMMRSINTTLTTVLPVASMLIIGGLFLGGSSIVGFSLALFIGLLLGTYSSIFLAAPLLAWLKSRSSEQTAGAKSKKKTTRTTAPAKG